jgi:hypothetical protein
VASAPAPNLQLARRVLPPPLLKAITHVFAQGLSGCMLVGGTALAGFYAGHRRSDDIDLFTDDATAQTATVLAVRSLAGLGAELEVSSNSSQYFRALCRLDGHRFTVDVALHPGLSGIGPAVTLENRIVVACLKTLTMMKAAALVSRCSEKDLYDLLWIRRQDRGLTAEKLMELGRQIDAGTTVEGLLISLSGAALSEDSCDFSLDPAVGKRSVYQDISAFKEELLERLLRIAEEQPAPPLGALIKKVRRLRGK